MEDNPERLTYDELLQENRALEQDNAHLEVLLEQARTQTTVPAEGRIVIFTDDQLLAAATFIKRFWIAENIPTDDANVVTGIRNILLEADGIIYEARAARLTEDATRG
jgi:hypothetical protein